MIESKKSLTPEEVLIVAQGAMTYGMAQHHLAGLYGVDSGRIAEAVVAMRWAMENHKTIYRHIQKMKKNGKAKLAATKLPLTPTPLEMYITNMPEKPAS